MESLVASREALLPTTEEFKGGLIGILGRLTHEALVVLALDENARTITYLWASGGLGSATADYRSIIGEVIGCGAHYLVLAHNHPSAMPCPSPTDVRSTRELSALALPLRILVADHLIVTRDSAFSMREAGLLNANDDWAI